MPFGGPNTARATAPLPPPPVNVTVAFVKFLPDPALSFNISTLTTDPPETVAVACALSPIFPAFPDIVTVGAVE